MRWLVFMGLVISLANEWEEKSQLFWRTDEDFQDWGHHPLFGLFPGTVMAPMCVSFSTC